MIVLGIVCLKLTSIDRTKSPIHRTRDPSVEFMENLFHTVYVIFSEIRNCAEIRLCSSHHPFYLKIDFTAFSQFSWRTNSFSIPIDIQFIHPFWVITRAAFPRYFFYSVFCKLQTVDKGINQPRDTLRSHERIPGTHHHLCTVKRRNIWHNLSPRIRYLLVSIILCPAPKVLFSAWFIQFSRYKWFYIKPPIEGGAALWQQSVRLS